MTRSVLVALGVLGLATAASAQSSPEIDKALLAAPRQARDGATVITWKADFTYDTLRKGTNQIVCYDQSGQPSEQPFSVQCTSLANLARVAQNKRFEVETDRAKRQALVEAAEKDGTRVKPEYGSVFWNLSGAEAQMQTTQFLKNLAILGGLLLLIAFGPSRYSIDARLRRPIEA